jgi:hypothetical protein
MLPESTEAPLSQSRPKYQVIKDAGLVLIGKARGGK